MKNLFIIIFLLTFFGCKKSDDGTAAIAGGNTTAAFTFNTVAGANGRIWMDRNLGATQVATSSTDVNSYGDLYQWGRGTDGHQKRTSTTTSTRSSTDVPGNALFIIQSPSGDWRATSNNNLWQGVNGVNNPCPSGYRLPTASELNTERLSWSSKNAAGAFASPLKLPMAGGRNYEDGSLGYVGTNGSYWGTGAGVAHSLTFDSGDASMQSLSRAYGFSVRCIKN